MNRREFLIMTSAAVVTGCQAINQAGVKKERVVNAGLVSRYTAQGVYPEFKNQGFFIVRSGNELFALSSVCTYKRCALAPQTDGSLGCPCHGCAYDARGHVTKGPAVLDLPVLTSTVNEQLQLLVSVPR